MKPQPSMSMLAQRSGTITADAVDRLARTRVEDCYQCGKCTAGCPVAGRADLMPNQVLRLAQRDDIVLGIATGKSMRGIEVVLGHYKLLPHFASVQCADTAPSKPAPVPRPRPPPGADPPAVTGGTARPAGRRRP